MIFNNNSISVPLQVGVDCILSYLESKDLSNCRLVSKSWNRVASMDRLWLKLFPGLNALQVPKEKSLIQIFGQCEVKQLNAAYGMCACLDEIKEWPLTRGKELVFLSSTSPENAFILGLSENQDTWQEYDDKRPLLDKIDCKNKIINIVNEEEFFEYTERCWYSLALPGMLEYRKTLREQDESLFKATSVGLACLFLIGGVFLAVNTNY